MSRTGLKMFAPQCHYCGRIINIEDTHSYNCLSLRFKREIWFHLRCRPDRKRTSFIRLDKQPNT